MSEVISGALDEGVVDRPVSRRQLRNEVLLVFAVSLGASGVFALLDLISSLLAAPSLPQQHVSLLVSRAPQHWLDLLLQLAGVGFGIAPALLAIHLLGRTGGGAKEIGLDADQPARDFGFGAALAAVIGGCGLGLYLLAHHVDASLTLDVVDLPAVWWRIPVELLSALHDGVIEEIVVVGYLLTRLRQLQVRDSTALGISAVIRGSYHLYQGFGGFVGNAVMGLIFGWIFQRWGRVTPLVLAHFFIDAVAFVGWTELAGHVSWLPV